MTREQWAGMSVRPESDAPGAPVPGAPDAIALSQPTGATETLVEQILRQAEPAIEAIANRTEQQIREIAIDAEARVREEAMERRAQLVALRRELAERASLLLSQYDAINSHLQAVETLLERQMGVSSEESEARYVGDPRVRAIKMTLRERQRINIAYEEPLDQEEVISSSQDEPAPAQSPPTVLHERGRRRWWHRWQREAA